LQETFHLAQPSWAIPVFGNQAAIPMSRIIEL
jgi:hypothetical protein